MMTVFSLARATRKSYICTCTCSTCICALDVQHVPVHVHALASTVGAWSGAYTEPYFLSSEVFEIVC